MGEKAQTLPRLFIVFFNPIFVLPYFSRLPNSDRESTLYVIGYASVLFDGRLARSYC